MDFNQALEKLSNTKDEKAILSVVLKHPEKFTDIAGTLSPSDFYNNQNMDLFALLEKIYNDKATRGEVVFDPTTIQSASKKFNVASEFFSSDDGLLLIQALKNNQTFQPEALDDYVLSVKHFSARRKLYATGSENLNWLLTNNPNEMEVDEMISSVEGKVRDIGLDYHGSDGEFKKLFDGYTKKLIQKMDNPVKYVGLPTGFKVFDELTLGLRRKTMYVVTARPKQGKSSFCTNVALNLAKNNIPVLYLDTEMSTEEVETRGFAKLSGATANDLLTGMIKETDRKRVVDMARDYEDLPLYHTRVYGVNIEKIIGLVRKFVTHYVGKDSDGKVNNCLVVFDYIKMPDKVKNISVMEKETQILGAMTTGLKDLCGDLDIPFLTAAQVNREGDVAATDRIKWFADVIMRWEEKSEKEKEENLAAGTHRLRITEARGSGNCWEGINFFFDKARLRIQETDDQPPGILS